HLENRLEKRCVGAGHGHSPRMEWLVKESDAKMALATLPDRKNRVDSEPTGDGPGSSEAAGVGRWFRKREIRKKRFGVEYDQSREVGFVQEKECNKAVGTFEDVGAIAIDGDDQRRNPTRAL